MSDCCLCPMKTLQEYHAHFLCNEFFSLVIDQHCELFFFYSAGSLMHQSVNRQGAQNDDNNRHGCYLMQTS